MPNHEREEPLRFRHCHSSECNALFTICPCCDRGQRYCGSACRQRARRAQVAAGGRRDQASDAGREAHRQRQSRYRHRSSEPRVTHQGTLPITCPASNGAERLSRCSVCGRTSRWHDPFYPLPQRRFKSRMRGLGQMLKFLRFLMTVNSRFRVMPYGTSFHVVLDFASD